MILKKWQLLIEKLENTAKGIGEDILEESDEVKAFGEIALLRRNLETFLRENWDQ
jgi:hypothetical protein